MHTVQNYKLSKTNIVWQTESYSNTTDNFKVEKSARKSGHNWRRIHKNGVQNL